MPIDSAITDMSLFAMHVAKAYSKQEHFGPREKEQEGID